MEDGMKVLASLILCLVMGMMSGCATINKAMYDMTWHERTLTVATVEE